VSSKILDTHLLLLSLMYLKRVEGRKRLQKIVYILKEKYGIPFNYHFAPYLYGPYSSRLQNEVDILSRNDYVKARKIDDLYEYEFTPLGQKVAAELEEKYGPEKLAELKKRLKDLSEFSTEELVTWSKQLMNEKLNKSIFAK
jgi:uncharacterized protein YwgA